MVALANENQRTINGIGYRRYIDKCRETGERIVRFVESRRVGDKEILGRDGSPTLIRVETRADGTPVPKGVGPAWQSPSLSWSRLFDHAAMAAAGFTDKRRPNRDRSIQAEIDRCRSAGNEHLAVILEERHPEEPEFEWIETLVATGETKISFSAGNHHGCQGDELRALVERHRHGDFGSIGKHEDIDATPDDFWCPWLGSTAARNVVAIATGEGLVRSEYPLWRKGVDDAPDSAGSPRNRRDREATLKIVTVLATGKPPRTLVFTDRDHVQLP